MTIRWTVEAADNLDEIFDYLNDELPALAQSTMIAVHDVVESLREMPRRGRLGPEPGTREILVLKLPYLISYFVHEEGVVEILHIHHTSRDRNAL